MIKTIGSLLIYLNTISLRLFLYDWLPIFLLPVFLEDLLNLLRGY